MSEVVLVNWCGKTMVPSGIIVRPGRDAVPAIRAGRTREIKAPLILSPGPATLTEGLGDPGCPVGRNGAIGLKQPH